MERKIRMLGEGAQLEIDDKVWKVPVCLGVDDTVMFAKENVRWIRQCVIQGREKVNAERGRLWFLNEGNVTG